jgi:hypothetical protein
MIMELLPVSPTAKAPGSNFTMLEGIESGDGTTWLEPVTDKQYAAANES